MARLCLGRITTAHGVKGLVKVVCFGDDPRSLEIYGPLFTSETGSDTLRLTLKNPVKSGFLAQVDGIADRTAAQALRGTPLYVPRARLPKPEDGSYYCADLIGLQTVYEKDEPMGRVISVQNFGAGDLLEIAPPSGSAFLIPFTKNFIGDVDFENKKIFILNSARVFST